MAHAPSDGGKPCTAVFCELELQMVAAGADKGSIEHLHPPETENGIRVPRAAGLEAFQLVQQCSADLGTLYFRIDIDALDQEGVRDLPRCDLPDAAAQLIKLVHCYGKPRCLAVASVLCEQVAHLPEHGHEVVAFYRAGGAHCFISFNNEQYGGPVVRARYPGGDNTRHPVLDAGRRDKERLVVFHVALCLEERHEFIKVLRLKLFAFGIKLADLPEQLPGAVLVIGQ